MRILFILSFFMLLSPAFAKPTRTVHLSEGDLEPIYVEPGFSTLIKFDSHPEPGLIGDQDGFKVEYMKNLVAIKPLSPRGKTNLFIFTKEGQFNFQLITSRGRHDNVVYAQKSVERTSTQTPNAKVIISIGEIATRKIGKTATDGKTRLILESIATPGSKSTLIVKFTIQENLTRPQAVDPTSLMVLQGKNVVRIENIYLETKPPRLELTETTGLILLRASEVKKGVPMILKFCPGPPRHELQVTFSPDHGPR